MDNKESLDKLEEICSKEENIRKILQAKTKDDIKPLFEESSIELTDEKFDILKKVYMNTLEKLRNMSEEELESISGGKWENAKAGTGYGLSIGTPVGALVGGVAAFGMLDREMIAHGGSVGFFEAVRKIVGRTTMGVLYGAALGTTVGGLTGMGADLVPDGNGCSSEQVKSE